MDSVEEFLAYAIKLEEEAALRFGQLADAMDACGNREVGKLFRQLSNYSKMHQADAMARAGFRDMPAKGQAISNGRTSKARRAPRSGRPIR